MYHSITVYSVPRNGENVNERVRKIKVLITGADGQLGRTFSALLGENAIITDAYTLDITKPIVLDEPFDIIVNCAAYTNVDGAEDNPDLAEEINVFGTKNLVEFARKKDVPIVHVSTDYVFDGASETPYTEKDLVSPQSVYGKTKEAGERFVRQYEKHYIVRTAWLYSKHGKNFVKTIMRFAKEKGELQVVSDQIGCPTNAEDLTKQIIRLIKTNAYGTYHCTGSGLCSWYDFACEIVRLSDISCVVSPCKTGTFPAKAKRPAYSVLDNTKLEQITGEKMPDWKDSLAKFIHTL